VRACQADKLLATLNEILSYLTLVFVVLERKALKGVDFSRTSERRKFFAHGAVTKFLAVKLKILYPN
jgi:hypothetical protein